MLKTTRDMDIDSQSDNPKHMPASLLARYCNGAIGVPITYLDKHNADQFEILNANDLRCDPDNVKMKPHGLIKDSEASITVPCSQSIQVEREREADHVCPYHDQTSYLQALTDGTSRASANTHEFSYVRYCNGVMGVPITFMDKFAPNQFTIIGATESEGKGFSCGLWDETSSVAQPLVFGERKYKRIFVVLK